MARTRAFKSGNSQAVRIPAEIAYADNTELEIKRTGDMITIYPARSKDFEEAIHRLLTLPKPTRRLKRVPIEFPDRKRR